jgi:hypothetical protein
MTTYRIEIYRTHPDAEGSFARYAQSIDGHNLHLLPRHMQEALRPRTRPGTFALVIGIDGEEETVLERWRVDRDGRVLRARFCELEPELEQTGTAVA